MADIYGDLASANTYMADRGYAWMGTDEDKNAALLRAAEYIDSLGMIRPCLWVGVKSGGRSQVRQWPRLGATDEFGDPIDSTEVPAEIISASYEAAWRELANPGSLNPDYVLSDTFKSAKVGPLEVEYATSSEAGVIPTKPVIGVIDALVKPFLSCYNNQAPVYVV